jgi:hypothetical protein
MPYSHAARIFAVFAVTTQNRNLGVLFDVSLRNVSVIIVMRS